ncbi:MAG TPA: hypothetical protein PLI97_02365 [Fluviicola sp.]|nr:hypothetical protein [Fluviicola sp.]
MKKNVIFIKSDDISNVRIQKYFHVLSKKKVNFELIGWKRSDDIEKFNFKEKANYILKGGGYGNKKKLLFRYLIFQIKLISYLFKNRKYLKQNNVIAVNFDSALPLFLFKRILKIKYIYEIHDSFALSYRFPRIIKNMILKIDNAIMKNSEIVIHVDENRIVDINHNNLIIYNSPLDFFEGVFYERQLQLKFCILGNISSLRGAKSILDFAKKNHDIKFILVGKFYEEKLKDEFLELKNIEYFDYVPQDQLFNLVLDSCGIFSLYDCDLEINQLAASNKVYDAMMLGIPVITNKEVMNSKFISENGIGVVLNYNYDNSWSILEDSSFLTVAKNIGSNGRKLFETDYSFQLQIEKKLLPILI